jgi:DNA-directed RNA polymerase subunit E'/Rpb7
MIHSSNSKKRARSSSENEEHEEEEEEEEEEQANEVDAILTKNTRSNQDRSSLMELYLPAYLSRKITIDVIHVNSQLMETLLSILKHEVEGKCIPEGYVRPNSVRIFTISAAIPNQTYVEYTVIYRADICYPLENRVVKCVVKTITTAGIHARVHENYDIENPHCPITVFVARDHHNTNEKIAAVEPGKEIRVEIIGVKYELNDTCIFAIGLLHA